MGQLDYFHGLRIAISDDVHAIVASQHGRRLADLLEFSPVEQTALSTAILEVARNIVKYAEKGELILDFEQDRFTAEVIVIARDDGPGIPDVEAALQDGFSTGKSLGLGLPGAKRLMDAFELDTLPGRGTTITMRKKRS